MKQKVKKKQQKQINGVMHKHEISLEDGGEINGQGVINIYPISRPCLALPPPPGTRLKQSQ